MNGLKLFITIPVALSAVLLSSCETTSRTPRGETVYLDSIGGGSRPSGAKTDNVSYWDGENISGKSSIRISLSEQKAFFYKDEALVGISQISTGREGFDTPTGSYSILQKSPNHRSNLYGTMVDSSGTVLNDDFDTRKDKLMPGTRFEGAPMPHFMRVTNGGVGMHAGYLPGFPASHGCIRMPDWMAQNFFNHVSMGTPVKITP